ncbi:hypothetical protein B0T16DRAFT_395781 [Cercophora newfieldiana]|uniref:Heterokaryon incompatibility protein n=1 Tax=Cercophora newfieldiana TaxID=92897 RepID=A0AA40CZJ3_9PEZI|nr:hypothetical protein B0T16DRAFT_395781 [Cercophora newfieldiana]
MGRVRRIASLNAKAMLACVASLDGDATQQAVFASDTYERFNEVVVGFWKRDCKDPRDRIYAMLGFKPWSVEWTLTPDYSAAVEEVYTDYARVLLRNKQLVFLEDAGIWNRRSEAEGEDPLPSWVPEHRASRLVHTDRHPWHQSTIKTSNDPWQYCQPIVEWPKNRVRYQNQVRIEGVVIAKLKNAICRRKTPETNEDLEDYFAGCMYVALAGKKEGDKYFTGESIQDAVVASSVATFAAVIEGGSPYEDHKEAIARTGRYVFFTTEEGFIGYAPACLEISDVVVAFCGRPEVFIVRPVEKTLDFRLVSSCYIHGMMEGRFEYGDDYHMIPLV